MKVIKHGAVPPEPLPKPAPTYVLDVTEHEADLIRLALDVAGTTTFPMPPLPHEIILQIDRIYIDINTELGYREKSLMRVGFPEGV